ncbi:MAG: response regulator transcription factor [Clostridia bacterium]|nr:response regulator transcription factor [Clostridia bacterium]MBR6618741.1 response regulator transcription factor [Clostridia bacterium]
MKICICDDDSFTKREIRSLLENFAESEDGFDVSDFSCGEDLIEYYNSGNGFDIVFLDIEMKGMNGIEAAESIKCIAPETIIIFVSSHSSYVFDAFRIEALHFLVKPIKEKEFAEVFTRAMKKYTTVNASVVLKWESTRNKIRISNISYVEGYRRHLSVHTANGVYEAVGKISEIYDALRPHGFVRVHQGFIVNMNYIKNFNTNEVELTDGSKVAVSVRKKQEALKAYDIFIRKWGW